MFRFFRRPAPTEPEAPEGRIRFEGEPPNPDQPLFIVGDIHGQIRALDALLDRAAREFPTSRLVFVGDFIDRGESSADVLSRLYDLSLENAEGVFILGNHEEMFLAFLDAPEEAGNRWLKYGGLQTMASFGSFHLRENSTTEMLVEARDKLRSVMPNGLENWLRSRPRHWQSGNVGIVHAGADPQRPLNEQRVNSLTWGHKDFGRLARQDGLWIVHGHTIVEMPREKNGVISIDTGAYATGKLTAAHIDNGQLSFVQASGC
ncbi:metallophosphoesterase family protein [Celeribacter litoreus]|uniref:metallophosphoesterase family protein n=1 Tax=Celeribacter litoreus TaxID=2876714 RepID=UPI001CCCEFEC|nr:metallophosphoesterase family protein [Celeribacter litoreus]MCA0044263.1 serine/threonine protein phosphatase [Celeribacter litoreus]